MLYCQVLMPEWARSGQGALLVRVEYTGVGPIEVKIRPCPPGVDAALGRKTWSLGREKEKNPPLTRHAPQELGWRRPRRGV